MEKITGKVIEVSDEYKIKVDSSPNWLEGTQNAQRYINKDLVGKEVDIVIENNKITFIKVLGGGNGGEKSNDLDTTNDLLKSINLNLGNLSIINKLRLFYDLEVGDKGMTKELQLVHNYLKKDIDKYLEYLSKIQEEQNK